MLDRFTMPNIDRWVSVPADWLAVRKVSPDLITVAGFLFGLACVVSIVYSQFALALSALAINRLADGLDGAVARRSSRTAAAAKAGGYLDICLDFLFYAGFVLAFALQNPDDNALIAAVVLACYIGTGSSFLAFAAAGGDDPRADLPKKTFYYLQGLAEGTETVIFMLLCLMLPTWFTQFALVFALMCSVTLSTRIYSGYRRLLTLE
ncbi:MAG: CDP-alcohol phosphatidyltransferase family protein [Gammaproteobacteria bacterium]|nr:CDP-alcohol phosphatidyltransferase family protein [Gammaproteobacteria bacterium]